MKKPHVLNRPMFNQGGTSAYGKGISANLVTEEQRQRFNYGGRVRLANGSYLPYQIKEENRIYNKYYEDLNKGQTGYYPIDYDTWKVKEWDDLTSEGDLPGIEELQREDYYDRDEYTPYKIGTASQRPDTIGAPTRNILARGVLAPEREGTFEDLSRSELLKEQAAEKGDVWIDESKRFSDEDIQSVEDEALIKRKSALAEDPETPTEEPGLPTIKPTNGVTPPPSRRLDTELLDIESIIDKYYKPKVALGEGLMGMAGTVLAASQQGSKAKAAAILGEGFGKFGKTLAAQKKEKSKLGATLEGQREIYRQSRIAKGEADIRLAERRAELKAEGADERDLSNIEEYSKIYAWDEKKLGLMTGRQHKDLVARFDKELAEKALVMEQEKITKDGETSVGFSEFDIGEYNKLKNGDPIMIGNQLYVKDPSIPPGPNNPEGMRPVSYTDYILLKNKKPAKKFNRFSKK